VETFCFHTKISIPRFNSKIQFQDSIPRFQSKIPIPIG